jgi:hypothetical protein
MFDPGMPATLIPTYKSVNADSSNDGRCDSKRIGYYDVSKSILTV